MLIGVFSTFSIATFWIIAPIRKTKKLLNNLRVGPGLLWVLLEAPEHSGVFIFASIQ